MSTNAIQLLKQCFPLIPQHGFTRKAIALASSSSRPCSKPNLTKDDTGSNTQPADALSETAISALFGPGDDARRTLIKAWLKEGVVDMGNSWKNSMGSTSTSKPPTLSDLLQRRLEWNKPAMHHLSEAFALLTSPTPYSLKSSIALPTLPFPFPSPLPNPLPLLEHAFRIADEALVLSTPTDQHTSDNWYTTRTVLSTIYLTAELHQLTSPSTAPAFLNSLLSNFDSVARSVDEVGLFADYVMRGWKGILKSGGAF